MKAVKARKDAISGESRSGVESMLRGLPNGTLYSGHARFESAARRARRRRGPDLRPHLPERGRPRVHGLHPRESAEVPYWTNSSMMEVDFVPPHLVIVGGSYVGLEFAQMYRRFGSAVTVVEMSKRLIAREDEDVSAAIRGDRRGRGHRRARGCRVHRGREGAVGSPRAASTARRGRPVVDGNTPPPRRRAAVPTPTIWGSTAPASRSTNAATSRSTTSSARRFPESGRSGTATAGAPSPTPPTTTSRSSPRTCSTATRAGSRTASTPTPSSSILRWDAPA